MKVYVLSLVDYGLWEILGVTTEEDEATRMADEANAYFKSINASMGVDVAGREVSTGEIDNLGDARAAIMREIEKFKKWRNGRV